MGIDRVRIKIGMVNMAYTMRRMIWIVKQAASA